MLDIAKFNAPQLTVSPAKRFSKTPPTKKLPQQILLQSHKKSQNSISDDTDDDSSAPGETSLDGPVSKNFPEHLLSEDEKKKRQSLPVLTNKKPVPKVSPFFVPFSHVIFLRNLPATVLSTNQNQIKWISAWAQVQMRRQVWKVAEEAEGRVRTWVTAETEAEAEAQVRELTIFTEVVEACKSWWCLPQIRR